MRATKIKMMSGCSNSNDLLEIDEIYLEGCTNPGFFKKAVVHDHVKAYPGSIQVNISPYPNVIDAISINHEKYVKSSPDSTTKDNLLSLPRV